MKHSTMPAAAKIAVGAGAAVAGAAVAFAPVLAKRHRVRATCKPFYSEATRHFKIPDINHGFVPQDLFYLDDEKTWLFSGYMANRKPSPIFQVGEGGEVRRHEVRLPDGSLYRGHGAAITAAGPHVFLTVRDGFVVLDRAALATAADGDPLEATGRRAIPLEPAFMNVQKGMLYIGEFQHRLFYPTPKSHWLTCPSGEVNPALVYAYAPHAHGPVGFGEHPAAVYSIPGNVQGLCVTPDGNIALSLSWGFGDAEVRIYDPARAHRGGSYLVDGHRCPLYFLDDATLVQTLTVPPMAEGIDEVDGEIYLASESASNLHLLGKFYGGGHVYSFPAE